MALSRLEEVITKYATKQEDAAELERQKRQEKGAKGKEVVAPQTLCIHKKHRIINLHFYGSVTKTDRTVCLVVDFIFSCFQGNKSGEGADDKEVDGAAAEEEEDEDDEDEEDVSSDPDIADDILASTQQEGAGESRAVASGRRLTHQ